MYKYFLFSINVDFLHIFKHLICTLIYMTNNCWVTENHECVHWTTVFVFALLPRCSPQFLCCCDPSRMTFLLLQSHLCVVLCLLENSGVQCCSLILSCILNPFLGWKYSVCIKRYVFVWRCPFLCVDTCIYLSKFLFSFHFYNFKNFMIIKYV